MTDAPQPTSKRRSFWTTPPGVVAVLASMLSTIVGSGILLYVQRNPRDQPTLAVVIRADPYDYRGPCPVLIAFSGAISLSTKGGGIVTYRLLRSDGASRPIHTLSFTHPGTKDISDYWQVGGPGLDSYDGWESVQIVEPLTVESTRASFRVKCE